MAAICTLTAVNGDGKSLKPDPFTVVDLQRIFHSWGISVPRATLTTILESLDLTYFRVVKTPYAETRYAPGDFASQLDLNAKLLVKRTAYDNGLEEIWKHYDEFGLSWLLESLRTIGEIHQDVVDEWEPLPLDYDAPEANEAIDAIEKAVEAIKQDNGYAATFPAERDAVVEYLGDAVARLRVRGEYTRLYFKLTVMEPLKRAASRLGESAAGKVVEAAIKGVQKWVSENVFELLSRDVPLRM